MGIFPTIHQIGSSGGGEPFQYYGGHDGRMLKKIGVWAGPSQIKALQVWLTGGESPQTFGIPSGPYREFDFEPSERITKLSLWGNGAGTRAGWIYFRTSNGRDFDHGMTKWGKKTEYHIDVGSGMCVGVQGRCGWDIDAIAFVFLKPLASACLVDVQFPSLCLDGRSIAPITLQEFIVENDNVAPRNWEFEDSVEVTAVSKWSVTHGFEMHTKLSVTAKIPEVLDVQAEMGWKMNSASTTESTQCEKRTLHWRQSGVLQPGERVALRVVVRRGDINTEFRGAIQVVLESGERFSYPVSGQYQGISYSGVAITPC